MSRKSLDSEFLIPLSPNDYQVLVCLAQRPLHGGGIIAYAKELSLDCINLSTGTIYPALRRLNRLQYIYQCNDVPSTSLSPFRIYALTQYGWLVLEQETSRLRQATVIAQSAINHREEQYRSWSDTVAML